MAQQDKPNVLLIMTDDVSWSAMRCTNPQCFKELLYLREGMLELLELEPDAEDQLRPDDGAFAMRPLPSKCFWLCGECAITYVLRRWTASGLVVLLRNQNAADGHPDLAAHTVNTGRTTPRPPLRAEEASWPKAKLAPNALPITGFERRGQTARQPLECFSALLPNLVPRT